MMIVTWDSAASGERRFAKARLGRRFLASLIDLWIGIVMPIIASAIGLVATAGRGRINVVNVLLFLSSLVWAVYYTFTKDAHNEGQSIGKRAMQLQVVRVVDGQPCSAGQSSVRAFVGMLTNAIPFVGWLVEPAFAVFSRDGRRLGDLAAGTQVINRPKRPDLADF